MVRANPMTESLKNIVSRTYQGVKVLKDWPPYTEDLARAFLAGQFGLMARSNGFVNQEPAVFRLRNGYRLAVRRGSREWEAVFDIWLRHCYTPLGFELGRQDVVIDVGAHTGLFSVFASMRAKDGRIISVEPDPENFRVLEQNIGLNGIVNITPLNIALSDRSGEAELTLSADTISHSLHSKLVTESGSRKIPVKTKGLNNLVEEYRIDRIDFLKMNCEGSEYEILGSCSEDVLSKIRRMSIQYHYLDHERNGETLTRFLTGHRFKVTLSASGYHILHARRD